MRGTPQSLLGLTLLVMGANLLSLALAWRLFRQVQPAPEVLRERLEVLATTTDAELDTIRADLRASEATIKLIKSDVSRITRWQTDMFNPEKGWRRDVTQTLRQVQATQAKAVEERQQIVELLAQQRLGRCLGLGWAPTPEP